MKKKPKTHNLEAIGLALSDKQELSNCMYLPVINEQISILDLDATPTLNFHELALVTLRTAKFRNQLVVQDGI